MKTAYAILLVFVGALNGTALAQPPVVEATEKKQVVEAAAATLEKQYVFADVAAKMAALIRQNLEKGQYQAINSPPEFAERLTDDLRSISRDRHLRVMYAPERIREQKNPDEAARRKAEQVRKRMDRMGNYAFREVEILPGNIGYLKFDGFSDAPGAYDVAVGAMAFLANCDALIVDLRDNGGGSPQMIQVLTSYFFEGEPRHLNSFENRAEASIEQTWTLPYVPGTRMPATPIYVLTSNRTFSGAEEFTYNLKNLKRATIVGETTGGGAHPVRTEILTDNYAIGVPFARAVNPITKTNWEGTGVEPDVKVAASEALHRAQVLALEKMASGDEDAQVKAVYQWALDGLRVSLEPPVVPESTLRSYVGTYGPRVLTFENGALYYQRGTGRRMKMVPMADDYFQFQEIDSFRLKIVRKDGRAVALEGRYDDGSSDTTPASK